MAKLYVFQCLYFDNDMKDCFIIVKRLLQIPYHNAARTRHECAPKK